MIAGRPAAILIHEVKMENKLQDGGADIVYTNGSLVMVEWLPPLS
jgi:hypothetical protein